MALDTFLLYLATWTLVALSPGPAVMFSMSQAARHGMRGAIGRNGRHLARPRDRLRRGGVRPRGAARKLQRRGRRRSVSPARSISCTSARRCCFRSRVTPKRWSPHPRRARMVGSRCRDWAVQLTESKAAAVRAGVAAAVHQARLPAAAAARDHAGRDGGDRRHRIAGLRAARRRMARAHSRDRAWSRGSSARSVAR